MSIVKSQKIYFLFLSICLIFFSCKDEPPIPDNKFIQVYVDILVAQDTTTVIPYSIDSLRKDVLAKNNISSAQYDSMINYYNARPEKWNTFFDSITVYVDRLMINAEDQH